jgi:lipoprotein-anchoring transpeptidase ErfK/SrfK
MYLKTNEILIALILIIVFFSCQQIKAPSEKNNSTQIQQQLDTSSYELDSSQKSEEPVTITYKMANTKQWLLQHKTDRLQQAIVFAVNRTDRYNFSRMDSVVIPTNLSFDLLNYLPFPLKVNYLKDINKIIFFSYPTQTFAAYEKGVLVYSGPTNMGKEKYLTPTGLFFTNWKAKVSTSTVNEKWILNWNFNVLNKEGIGWHQYSLPGYPVSHSCLRLQKKDAKYLYYWADQWVLANKYKILIKGTPVIIFGNYDFSSPKPWLQLPSNPHSLNISEEEIRKITQPFLNEILSAQKCKETIQDY